MVVDRSPEQQLESDSSLNFDPIREWLIDLDHVYPMTTDSDILHNFDSGNFELGHQDTILEAFIDQKMEKVSLANSKMDPSDADCNKSEAVEASAEVGNDTVSNGVVGEGKNDAVSEVCMVNDPIIAVNESNDGERRQESEESVYSSGESSSSSSLSSSSSDEEEESSSSEEEEDGDEMEKVELAVEVEEGEIDADELEEAILSSDGEEAVPKGPIKSKHEIEDLPPVPPLEVSLEQHHQTLPVGVISSILGSRVIVEGSEKHTPLNEGSILWITETRLPLGRIDEIFGPVKNPYYIVRYNYDKEVPQGINIGSAVSFVVDFASHILNEKYLYEKGYDTLGVDDEEVNEVEFSDDEKEAEYKRSLRQKKREMNHWGKQESGFGKKSNFKGSGFHKDKQLQSPHSLSSQPGHLHARQAPVNFGCINNFNSAHGALNFGTNIASSSTMMHAFPSQQLNTLLRQGIQPQPSPLSIRGFPPQPMGLQSGYSHQPQIMAMQGGLPLNWMPAQYQNQFLNNFVGGIMQYQQQQLLPNGGALPGNLPWFGGPSNQSVDISSDLFGLMAQGGFAQAPLGCGIVNQSAHGQTSPVINQGESGQIEFYNVNLQGSSVMNNNGQNHGQALPVINHGGFGQVPFGCSNANPNGHASGVVNSQSEMRPPTGKFNQGRSPSSSNRGVRPYGRGGGRHSFGRRGGSQRNG